MIFFLLVFLCSGLVNFAASKAQNVPKDVPHSFDCEMRKLAYEFGQQKIPFSNDFKTLFDALELKTRCGVDIAQLPKKMHSKEDKKDIQRIQHDQAIYVDCKSGSDEDRRDGHSKDTPFMTLEKAIEYSRSSKVKQILLNTCTYYLEKTIQLTGEDSGLLIAANTGHVPVISGAKPLGALEWSRHAEGGKNKNIWVADIPASLGLTDIPGLHYDGGRAIVARYPNCDPWIMNEEWDGEKRIPKVGATFMPNRDQGEIKYIRVDSPARSDTHSKFHKFVGGSGGICDVYDPPFSYWCAESREAGSRFSLNKGMVLKKEYLPNLPYKSGAKQLVVNIWRPGRWENYMFEGKYDQKAESITFTRGGFQGARGLEGGGDWFIQNVFEELDYPNEFFYDRDTAKLYFYFNGTGSPGDQQNSARLNLAVPHLEILINVDASQASPASDITFYGLKFTGAQETYLTAPHTVPSGGDWALERRGALFIEGSKNLLVDSCIFEKVDGHALTISGFNRNATVRYSEFMWVGGSAIVSWGRTASDIDEHGINGMDGNYPRYSKIMHNIAREVGHFEKQNSFYIQAKSAQSEVTNNVFFNGPRAGINYNDGFGGGDLLEGNLIFNTCRESSDHGPVNAWDRQPYLTDVADPKGSLKMLWREIRHNFLVANYQGLEGVDNDDGSGYFHVHHNFLVYGKHGLKSWYQGHDNYFDNNVIAFISGACILNRGSQIKDHHCVFHSNKCISAHDGLVDVIKFSDDGLPSPYNAPNLRPTSIVYPHVYNNQIYSPTGKVTHVREDFNTSYGKLPRTEEIIHWARRLLIVGSEHI